MLPIKEKRKKKSSRDFTKHSFILNFTLVAKETNFSEKCMQMIRRSSKGVFNNTTVSIK